ncbi:methylglyoxal synthase [Segetibacter aerophilus]|uniref:Methylglyoxal synthase n=1 Tax=Segetibacter aerophilus TaxID=670293 RepID=A0A512BCR7_9BACT|nr:methylglyoxal synthase [Segetibacter aerophilus]GEO09657.1 methylglyoxal synthase [Segetibacter aerophilus]
MSETRSLPVQKQVALVAHDKKKDELVEWALENKEILKNHQLIATGSTGKLIEEKLGLPVEKLLSGPLGGDQQIGSLIAEGKLQFLVFFWDPLEAQAHDSDVKALQRLAVAWNILLASNRTTANFVLHSDFMEQVYEIETPDYSNY